MDIKIEINGKTYDATISDADANQIQKQEEFPFFGNPYWYIGQYNGTIYEETWRATKGDLQILKLGNVFRTREEGENALRAQKLISTVTWR